ncbi:DNA-directed RNA polymerase subunit A' [Candidatus Pacearchaeota archaeon]|nr:DNA-directed RNA polymerase subunit A' [Candidatus Pacearchaeota archaeon]MBD3283727.1 DNA-directed RNA polymerase subunit A' [Candidatus Pacearchaeota archaeon]
MPKRPVRKQVESLQFTLLSPDEIKKMSKAKIITPELYDVDGYPVDGGLMDLRLGAIDPGVRCRTCGGRLKECLGHPGSIELARPVIHIKYIPVIELFLRCFCSECHKLMIKQKDLEKYKIIKDRLKKAKDTKKCPHCQAEQERTKLEKPTTFRIGKRRLFPGEIRDKLTRIPDEEARLAGINPEIFRPEWAILTLLLVPPVTVRPSITLETGERSEDDLTHKLSDIIRANQRLWENLNAGAPEVIIEDLWDLLQYHVTTFFDNSITKIPPARHRSGQPLKTITERIKGKEGRIRHNLAGKRVNFSSRTVISPDPALKINEVGVPFEIAKILTVNEKVNSSNIQALKNIIKRDSYPAANYIIRPDGRRKRVTPDLRDEILEELSPGYIVERQLVDGDICLFNRHPSLHKASLMAHFIKILPYKTFRIHPAAAAPYNADFDGDEMNIHIPQTEEARAEAKILMDVNQNLFSCKDNSNMLGCIADAVTGNYLLSYSNISKTYASQLLYKSGIESKGLKKEISGREILSELIPKIDYKSKTKIGEPFIIKNGRIDKGIVDEKIFGVESGNFVKVLDKEIGREKTIETLERAFTIGTNYLSNHGFTISVDDLSVNEKVKKSTEDIIREAERETENIIEKYHNKTLEIIPGKTLEESREIKILQTLNSIRTKIGKIVGKEIPNSNPVSVMMSSGAGGNVLNVTQMACCVGQQALWGKRISIGFSNRTLSFFKEGNLSPKSRGFIYSSFLEGLQPYEFFFGAITGRDALMDTALRTPKSGYLYRRLANALQDIRVEYDNTVRDGSGKIIQFMYGDDGKDISGLHKDKNISSGEAIGIITAQSFGEPSTQMALNVFHFAGVSEMAVTSGLPRLIEIFDARRTPSTPEMEIYLDKEHNNDKNAKVIAEKIQEVKLKDIVKEIKINFSEKKIEAVIDTNALKRVHSSIDTIAKRLNEEKKIGKCKVNGNSIIFSEKNSDFKEIYKSKEKIKETIISGIKGIEQILVVKRDHGYVILTAGSNLKEIMNMKGIDKTRTISNDIHEVAEILGIEVARETIIKEIEKVTNSQGLDVDKRHSMLIADAMTSTGIVKGITRMGIISQKSSILARASFETPVKQFVNATLKDNKDELNSVIENIILNQPVPVGTGLPGLMVEVTGPLTDQKPKKDKSVEYLTKDTKDTSTHKNVPVIKNKD